MNFVKNLESYKTELEDWRIENGKKIKEFRDPWTFHIKNLRIQKLELEDLRIRSRKIFQNSKKFLKFVTYRIQESQHLRGSEMFTRSKIRIYPSILMGSTVQGNCLGYYYYALCTRTCVYTCVLSNHIPISFWRRAKKAIPRSIERDRRRCIGDDRYCSRYRRHGESSS